MRKWIIITLMSVFPCVLHAEGTAKRENVEKLLAVTKAESLMDSMYAEMDKMFAGMAQQLGVKKADQPIFDRFMAKTVAIMKAEMSWAKMKEPLVDVYLKHYSDKEIGDMLAFYESETGKSMVAKMPAVMRDSMQVSQGMMHSILPKVQALSQELQAELKAARSKRPN